MVIRFTRFLRRLCLAITVSAGSFITGSLESQAGSLPSA